MGRHMWMHASGCLPERERSAQGAFASSFFFSQLNRRFYCLAYICTKEVGVFGVGAECECQGGWAQRLISYKKLPCSSRSGLNLGKNGKKLLRAFGC